MTGAAAETTTPAPSDPLCVVTDDGYTIAEAERDRNLFTAGSWPQDAARALSDGVRPCTTATCVAGCTSYNEEERPGEDRPSELWEALLRFPQALVYYATHVKRVPPFVFAPEDSWPNFHTMRVLGRGTTPPRKVKHVYLLHNGLRRIPTDLTFHYRLAAWILATRRDAVCILRPLPGHLTRFAFQGPYAEQPLDATCATRPSCSASSCVT